MPVPKPSPFLLDSPLYSRVRFEGFEIWDVIDILYYDGTYDNYCTQCGRSSTFQVHEKQRPEGFTRNAAREKLFRDNGWAPEFPPLDVGAYHIQATCARSKNHIQDFICLVDDNVADPKSSLVQGGIQKIGQFPSYGDLHIAKVKKYRPVLSSTQLSELTRAIHLASHDVGVGAYVYLRRIFESLVEDAHQLAKNDAVWNETEYLRMRMNERIAALRSHLPSFLVEHPHMYALLSKGVHELSEEECLQHFDTLRIGIELILDERLEQRERASKIAAATAALGKAVSK